VNNEITVSIACITYNHEKYIIDAMESFLMQKTDFKFEILIHDDASTDNTAKIIRNYQNEYPDLIHAILQTENQYSQGIDVGELNTNRAKGKYIAICEGDDFWTDPLKLQKQVEYLEAHPECSLCVHDACIVTVSKKRKRCFRLSKKSRMFTITEIIEGGGGLFPTNSIMYPRRLDQNKPLFYKMAPVGDYPLVIYLALHGTVYYINESMSAYRTGVSGSWTERELYNLEKNIKHFEEISKMLDEINKYTDYQYEEAIKNTKNQNQFNILYQQGKYKELRIGNNKKIYDRLGFMVRLKILIQECCPRILRVIRSIRTKYKLWIF